MSNTNSPTTEEFQRSLTQLIQQAQQTAQLGFTVAREQVEDLVKNAPTPPVAFNAQMEDVRRNFQNIAREIEVKAQELVSAASQYVPQGRNPFTPPASTPSATEVKVETAPAEPAAANGETGTGNSGSV